MEHNGKAKQYKTKCAMLIFLFSFSNLYNILDECILAQQQQHNFN